MCTAASWRSAQRSVTTSSSSTTTRCAAASTIELAKLQRFLGAGVVLDGSSIVPPALIGRFKAHGLMPFDPADVAFVAELGFDTTC